MWSTLGSSVLERCKQAFYVSESYANDRESIGTLCDVMVDKLIKKTDY